MNKRTLVLLLLLVVVLGGAYFLVSRSDNASTLNEKEINFAVQDTALVTKIFITNRRGENNLLEKQQDGTWTINKKYQAQPSMVSLLLKTMQQMQVKRPVARQARNTVIRTLASQGTKVEVYNKEGLIKTFYVGGNSSDEKGSHFLMEGSENPYVLHIRGFDGYLSSRFTLKEKEWRSRQIFNSIPPAIQEITLVYNDSPSTGFTIRQQNDKFVLADAPTQDSAAVKWYVAQFNNLHAEMLINDAPQSFLDSLSLITPRAILTLKDADPAKSQKLVVYPNPTIKDRMVARYGQKGENLCTIQQYAFGNVLIRKKQLFTVPKTAR
ncbi:MAG: DUF4340 domain-containing protein [Chitinophagaceae bacterium]|nr:MAG: DUF4340 domain-containing protein [Chitinophagaceae bacterium]